MRKRDSIGGGGQSQKKEERQKPKGPHWIKSFIFGFVAAGAGIDLLVFITDGVIAWALDTMLVKTASSIVVSLITVIARLIIRKTIQSKKRTTMKKFFQKVGAFFARLGRYIKANKRTLGGIISSAVSGTLSVSVCVLGYTVNLTELLTNHITELAWLQHLKIKGFDIAPIVGLIVGLIFTIWNIVAAISRGWETPETYSVKQEELKAEKEAQRLENERLKAEAEAKAEEEEEQKRALAEAQAELLKEQTAKEQEAVKAAEAEERQAKETKHRQLVEKYKAELLKNLSAVDTASDSNN